MDYFPRITQIQFRLLVPRSESCSYPNSADALTVRESTPQPMQFSSIHSFWKLYGECVHFMLPSLYPFHISSQSFYCPRSVVLWDCTNIIPGLLEHATASSSVFFRVHLESWIDTHWGTFYFLDQSGMFRKILSFTSYMK